MNWVSTFNSVRPSIDLSSHLGQRAFVGVRDFCGSAHIPGASLKRMSVHPLEMQYGSQQFGPRL